MAEAFERLLVRVEANSAQFEAQMKKINRALYASSAETRKSLDTIQKQVDRRGATIANSLKQNLLSIAPTLAAAFSAREVLRYADSWSAARNQLASAGVAASDLASRQSELTDIANRSLSSAEATVKLYSRLTLATERFGTSSADVLRITELVNKSFVASGASGTEAASGILQLSQALASGVLQGDELRSLRENAPQIAQAIATAMGVSIGELKKLGAEGKITADVVTRAILAAGDKIEARFEAMTPTVAQAFTVLNNEIGRFIGQSDSGLSATQRMSQAIIALSKNLDTVALVVGAVATVMGGRFVLAMTAGSGAMIANGVAALRLASFQTAMTASMTGTTTATVVATGAMRSFSAAIAANPIGAALIAVAALAAGLVYLRSKFHPASIAARELNDAVGAADTVLAEYKTALDKAAAATGAAAAKAREEAAAIRATTLARIDDLRVLAQQRAADAAGARAAEAAAKRDIPSRGRGQGPTGDAIRSNRELNASTATTARSDAETAANAAFDAYKKALAGFSAAEAPTPAPAAVPAGGSGGGGSASGASPEDLARQREVLELQGQIERLRAQGRDAEADARQDALDLLNLTKQYADAGFEDAKGKAEKQVQALAAAREEARARDEAREQAEGEARALDMMRRFTLDMLDVEERLALTDRDALEARRKILAVRQAERRAALEAAAADVEAMPAERAAAQSALGGLGALEAGENRDLEASSGGARLARGIAEDLKALDDSVERAAEAYAEIDRLRQEDVLNEQQAALAKAQIDQDLREQRLAGTRTMLDTVASLQGSSNKKLAALGKAAAIAQATIDGVLAVQKALASAPPPFNFIQAAIVGAVAAANVASIAGMADGGLVTGPGGPREDKVLRRLSAGEFVVNARSTAQNRELLEQINRGGGLPALSAGGIVGRVDAAAARVASIGPREPGSPLVFSPTIDARGADIGVERRLQAQLDGFARDLPGMINGVRDRRAKYRLGPRRDK